MLSVLVNQDGILSNGKYRYGRVRERDVIMSFEASVRKQSWLIYSPKIGDSQLLK